MLFLQIKQQMSSPRPSLSALKLSVTDSQSIEINAGWQTATRQRKP